MEETASLDNIENEDIVVSLSKSGSKDAFVRIIDRSLMSPEGYGQRFKK